MNLADYIKDLDPELQEKALACGSLQELLALAKDAKVSVPDEALAAIAGGQDVDSFACGDPKCPLCGSTNVTQTGETDMGQFEIFHYKCNDCRAKFDLTKCIG